MLSRVTLFLTTCMDISSPHTTLAAHIFGIWSYVKISSLLPGRNLANFLLNASRSYVSRRPSFGCGTYRREKQLAITRENLTNRSRSTVSEMEIRVETVQRAGIGLCIWKRIWIKNPNRPRNDEPGILLGKRDKPSGMYITFSICAARIQYPSDEIPKSDHPVILSLRNLSNSWNAFGSLIDCHFIHPVWRPVRQTSSLITHANQRIRNGTVSWTKNILFFRVTLLNHTSNSPTKKSPANRHNSNPTASTKIALICLDGWCGHVRRVAKKKRTASLPLHHLVWFDRQ